MAKAGTRAQRMAERRQQILDAARAMAEADGWTAVTSRRLADAIGYTQPVLYGHFPGGKTEIMRTVALAGFAELAAATQAAIRGKTGRQAVAAVAEVYLGFAAGVGKTYEMLQSAHAKLRAGADVVVGFVETHGRAETEALLVGLEVVPRKRTLLRHRTASIPPK